MSRLPLHQLPNEAPPKKPYQCMVCQRWFKSPTSLVDHQRDSHGGAASGIPLVATPEVEDGHHGETFDKAEWSRQKQARSDRAQRDFMAAAQLAIDNGLTLLRHTPIHFQLKSPQGWIINLFPSNRRIYSNKGNARGPFLNVPYEWTLMDVVRAAIEVKSC